MADQRQEQPQQRRGQLLSLEELNRIVLEFLNKKGYARTEAMLRLESSRAATAPTGSATGVTTGQMPVPPAMNGPEVYARAYLALKTWVEASLDLYQPELSRVLYPVFVHMYLELLANDNLDLAREFFETFSGDHRVLHHDEIDALAGLKLPNHVEENETAQRFYQNKYKVIMSRTSFDLLLSFLHHIESIGGIVIIRVINGHLDLQQVVAPGLPSADQSASMLPGEGLGGSTDAFNTQPVRLGRLPMSADFQEEVGVMLQQHDKDTGDELAPAFEAQVKPETDSPTIESLPLPKYRTVDVDAAIQKMVDAENRLPLGTPEAPLPSVCMYTFHNTHDEMNTLKFSDDATLCAAGFGDSFVQLWNLKGSRLGGMIKEDRTSSPTRRLVGHSGAVYGLSFAPDNRTLLSASEDHTVRLWSLDTYSALVSYKGHTEPVWDVQYGPFGHYFATASHDQTARLWSCDHIYPLRIFAGHMSDVDNVTFHPNGTYLFTGSSDRTVRMWDINKGQSVRVFIGHVGAVTATAVSPDGRWLATAGDDSIINLWDIGSGRRLKAMRGHGRAAIYSLAFSKEGSVLVSGSADNSVRVWDVKKNTSEQTSAPEPFEHQSAKVGGEQRKRKEIQASTDHMAVFHTKRTPVYQVQFTERNLVLAGGAFMG